MTEYNFDPYDEIISARRDINELIRAYNAQAETIRQLLEQNRKLNHLVHLGRNEVNELRLQIKTL